MYTIKEDSLCFCLYMLEVLRVVSILCLHLSLFIVLNLSKDVQDESPDGYSYRLYGETSHCSFCFRKAGYVCLWWPPANPDAY